MCPEGVSSSSGGAATTLGLALALALQGGWGQKQGWVECTALQTWCGALSLKNTQTCRPVKSPARTSSTSFSFHDWN